MDAALAVPALTRDALWAVLRWLPWREQLRVRRVCRTWCSVVHERVTTPPRGRRVDERAIPALLRCHLRALDLVSMPWSDQVAAALPTTLRCLSWEHARPAALSRLVLLEDLDVGKLNDCDLLALCSLHTLTRLQVHNVCECSVEAAARAASSLTRLCELRAGSTGDPLFEAAMLLHGPASLTRVLLYNLDAALVPALHRTPLHLEALQVPGPPFPLDRLSWLRTLDAGLCRQTAETLALLRGLAACTWLRSLTMVWSHIDAAVAPALGDLSALDALDLALYVTDSPDSIVGQLPRLTRLSKLSLRRVSFSRGRVQALAGLCNLRALKLFACSGDGLREELASLVNLRRLKMLYSDHWSASTLPVALETFVCSSNDPIPLAPVGQLTALRKLELRICFELRLCFVDGLSWWWGSLVHMEEMTLRGAEGLPRTLLFDVAAALPALRRVELEGCSEVDPLPLTSRVEAQVVDV